MNILSLCDGMSGGQITLKELGFHINNYFSYEIKKHAIETTQLNFPNTIQLGNINDFNIEHLRGNQIDILFCGSPCKNMSLANIKYKTGINGDKSSLFYKCADILKEVSPTYFLFENVASMTNADKEIISDILGVQPIKINSSLVSAQQRNRLYWTNIPNVTQPNDKGILLKDVLDTNPVIEEKWSEKKVAFVKKKADSTMYVRVDGEKSMPITARGYAAWNTQFISTPTGFRDLTISEYRKLQTIPDWYNFGNLSKSKITDLIGDGWTIKIISHILNFINKNT